MTRDDPDLRRGPTWSSPIGATGSACRPASTTLVTIEPFGAEGPQSDVPAVGVHVAGVVRAHVGVRHAADAAVADGDRARAVGDRRGGGDGGVAGRGASRPDRRGRDARGERARGDGGLPQQLPTALSPVHRLGVVHVAQRRLAAGGPCKDGWIGLCVFTAQQWSDFAAMIGRDDLAADDRLNSMGGRGAQPGTRPSRWCDRGSRCTPSAEICELGELFRVPVALVGNGRDVLAMEHFVDRGVFVERPEGFVAAAAAVPDVGVTGASGRGRTGPGCRRRRRGAIRHPRPRRRADGDAGATTARRRHRARPHRVLGRARVHATSWPRSGPTW